MISKELLQKVEDIIRLSSELEKTKDQNDYILHSLIEHAEEIDELFKKNNGHWAIETGDLIVQCIRLLKINGYDVNKLLEKIPERFIKKIKEDILGKNAPQIGGG